VKFAKVIPSVSDNERIIPVSAEIVERTKPAPVSAPMVQTITDREAAPAEGGAAHV
jgi:hypothetical protein